MQRKPGVLSIDCLISDLKTRATYKSKEQSYKVTYLLYSTSSVVLIIFEDIMKWSRVAALAPGFYLSRLLGITPLLTRKNRDGTLGFAANGILLAISLLHIIATTSITAFICITHVPIVIRKNPSYIPYTSCLVLSSCASIVILSVGLFYHRITIQALNEVYELSRQLTRHSDHNRLPCEAFFLPTGVVFTTIRWIVQTYRFHYSLVPFTTYQHSNLVNLSSQSLAGGFFYYLESFFNCLNDELSEIRLNLNSTLTETETRLILNHLKHLRKVHNRICDVCDFVCERFSLDLFIIFAVIVYLLISTLYAGIWARTVDFMWLLNVINVIHHGFIISRLAHICYRSDRVMKQSELTNARIQSLMTSHLPVEIKQEIYHFTLQTMLRKVEITACGYYGFRMETITTLTYLVTTYLVMVINLSEVV